MIRLVYDAPIRPMPRPRWGLGRVYLPRWYQRQKAQLRDWLAPLKALDFSQGVALTLCFKGRGDRGDLDNLVKAVLDALPFDDRHVSELHAYRLQHMLVGVYLIAESMHHNGTTSV